MKPTINTNNLPLPRLEFNWDEKTTTNLLCRYWLVLPIDDCDIRSNSENECGIYNEWRVLIGETATDLNRKVILSNGEVDTPFRDFVHMQIDNKSLGGNLPMFSVYGKHTRKIELNL